MSRYVRGLSQVLEKAADDVVIVSAVRTPFTRANKGGLASQYPEQLLRSAIKGAVEKSGAEKSVIEDVTVGAVLQTLGGQKVSAAAVKSLEFPTTTTINTVNRQCASSAQALSYLAASIKSGWVNAGIAAGVESMTNDYFPDRGIPSRLAEEFKEGVVQEAADVLMPMGITSEKVVKKFGIARADQDQFAKNSHDKAATAADSGYFGNEIVPVTVGGTIVSADDGIRRNVSLEKLGSLKPVFDEAGTTTAGNASQITDGASAAVVMRRSLANDLGLRPIGRFVASAVIGVPGNIMGVGPSAAVPKLLQTTGLTTKDIDIFELNEAFASQSLYCIGKLGIPLEKVNPFGGAIALGHPLGATGGRLVATLLNGLHNTQQEVGVLSMCTSTGQGFAGLLVRE